MFTNEDHDILSWLEKLVEKSQQLIYEKRKIWFHNDMELEDIDTAFTPPIRTYKSGKFYLVRTYIQNINNNPLNGFSCYDQNELKIDPTELNSSTKKIIPLLEIKGIKFSTKNFNFDITLKQAMIIEEENFLDNCLIKLNTKSNVITQENFEESDTNEKTIENDIHESTPPIDLENNENENENEIISNNETNTDNDLETKTEIEIENNNIVLESENNTNNEDVVVNENNIDNTKPVDYTENPAILDLEEVTINEQEINNLDDSINIKSPNEAYIELWKEARKKAKLARKAAIEAHLHAKKIKTEHMLDNLDEDSEDDYFDEYVDNLENVETEN